MDFNRILSILTMAGLFGLVILNPKASVQVLNALSGAANSYVATVQAR